MRIELRNETDLPPAGLRQVLRWVFRELDLNGVHLPVRVSRTDHWHHQGHFYMDEFEDGSRRFWLSLKLPWHYPYVHHATSRFTKRPLRGGPPPVDPQNEYEALVCISAHEGAHVKQAISEPKGKGYWQTRGSKRVFIEARRYSEVEAEYAEYELLNRFRERSSP